MQAEWGKSGVGGSETTWRCVTASHNGASVGGKGRRRARDGAGRQRCGHGRVTGRTALTDGAEMGDAERAQVSTRARGLTGQEASTLGRQPPPVRGAAGPAVCPPARPCPPPAPSRLSGRARPADHPRPSLASHAGGAREGGPSGGRHPTQRPAAAGGGGGGGVGGGGGARGGSSDVGGRANEWARRTVAGGVVAPKKSMGRPNERGEERGGGPGGLWPAWPVAGKPRRIGRVVRHAGGVYCTMLQCQHFRMFHGVSLHRAKGLAACTMSVILD